MFHNPTQSSQNSKFCGLCYFKNLQPILKNLEPPVKGCRAAQSWSNLRSLGLSPASQYFPHHLLHIWVLLHLTTPLLILSFPNLSTGVCVPTPPIQLGTHGWLRGLWWTRRSGGPFPYLSSLLPVGIQVSFIVKQYEESYFKMQYLQKYEIEKSSKMCLTVFYYTQRGVWWIRWKVVL